MSSSLGMHVRLEQLGSKCSPTRWAMRGVSIEFKPGEIHGVVGENGAGKSSTMNVLFGLRTADEGTMALDGRPYRPKGPTEAIEAGIGMVHQHFMLAEELTVAENLSLRGVQSGERGILSRTRASVQKAMQSTGFELDLDRLVGELSVGEQQRVEILKALLFKPRFLILDEPTAVLTPTEVADLFEKLRHLTQLGVTIAIITHKLREVMELADRMSVLKSGKLVCTVEKQHASEAKLAEWMVGTPVSQWNRDRIFERAAIPRSEESKCEVEELQRRWNSIQRRGFKITPRARIEATRGKIQSAEGAVARGRSTPLDVGSEAQTTSRGDLALEISGRQDWVLQLRPGEILGIAGVDGNGQSELIDWIVGLSRSIDQSTQGKLHLFGKDVTSLDVASMRNLGLGVVPANRLHEGVFSKQSLVENVMAGIEQKTGGLGLFGELPYGEFLKLSDRLLNQWNVKYHSMLQPLVSLSGGNQQKLVLAREFLSPIRVLVLAQPTRGVDLGAQDKIYDEVMRARGEGLAVLLISSELEEVLALSDRIDVMYRGRLVGARPRDQWTRELLGLAMGGGGISP